jgi:hypothetical protein
VEIFLSLLQVLTSAFAAKGLGRCCLGTSSNRHPAFQTALETAFGLFLLSYFLFAAASFQIISPKFLFGLWFLLIPLALAEAARLRLKWNSGTWGIWTAGIFFIFFIVLAAKLPASDRDELIYQLEIPRQWLLAHGFRFFPDNFYAYFPNSQNLLMLFGLGTAGETAAKLYHVLSGILLGTALWGYGDEKLGRTAAGWAIITFFSVSSVVAILPLAYVDLAYALYAFISFVLLLEFLDNAQMKTAFLSGIFAGACCCVKYTGIQFTILLEVFGFILLLRRRDYSFVKGLLLIGVVSFICFLPYLIRNWIFTGWPIFPFSGPGPLHPGINWDTARAGLYLGWLGQYGSKLGQASLGDLLLAPVLVFAKARFNEPQFYDGIIGPVFLLIPFLLLRKEKMPVIKSWILFSVLFLYYWSFTTRQVRFLIPVLPVLSLLLAYGVEKQDRLLQMLTRICLLLSLLLGMRQITVKDPLPFLLGRETRDHYLERQLPVYPIYQKIHETLKPGEKVYLIQMKNYGYYLEGSWTGDFVFERYRLDEALKKGSAESLKSFFEIQGIDFLLMDETLLHSPDYGIEPEQLPVWEEFLTKYTRLSAQDKNFKLYHIQ